MPSSAAQRLGVRCHRSYQELPWDRHLDCFDFWVEPANETGVGRSALVSSDMLYWFIAQLFCAVVCAALLSKSGKVGQGFLLGAFFGFVGILIALWERNRLITKFGESQRPEKPAELPEDAEAALDIDSTVSSECERCGNAAAAIHQKCATCGADFGLSPPTPMNPTAEQRWELLIDHDSAIVLATPTQPTAKNLIPSSSEVIEAIHQDRPAGSAESLALGGWEQTNDGTSALIATIGN